MRYGFFTTLAEPDNRRPYPQIIRDLREQAVLCDRAGFETVWLAEHHFGPEGMGYNNPFRGLTMFMNPGEQPQPGMTMGYDFLVERGNVLVGPPDHVVEPTS